MLHQNKIGEELSKGFRPKGVALVGLALLWLFAVFLGYYIVHKPFMVPQIVRVAGNVLDLLSFSLIFLIAAAWGKRFCRWLHLEFASNQEQLVYASALGLGLIGYAVLALGSLGLLYRWTVVALLLALGFGAGSEVVSLARGTVTGVRERLRTGALKWSWQTAAILYVLIIAIVTFGRALIPPTAWDALVYHLEVPRQYIAQHRIVPIEGFFYSNMPQFTEMLYLLGLALRADVLAQLIHVGFAGLLALATFEAARQWLSSRAALLSVVLLVSMPVITTLASWPYVDLALSFFLFCSLQAFFRWRATGASGWLRASAVCLGLALAVKYTAALWMGTMLLVVFWESKSSQRLSIRRVLGRLIGYSAWASLVAWPFYLKNLLFSGNPFYPFVFGGQGWNALRDAWTTSAGHGLGQNPLDYLVLPWNMTVFGVQGSASFDADIGPLLLTFVPLVAFLGVRGRVRGYLFFFVGVQFVFLAYSAYHLTSMLQTRLILAAFPLLCILAADSIDRLGHWDLSGFSFQRLASLAVAMVLILNLWSGISQFISLGAVEYNAGLQSRDSYLTKALGDYYRMADYVNENLPAAAVIAFWWEPRGYYYRQPVLADPTLDALPQLVSSAKGDVTLAAAALAKQGVTHVLLNQQGLDFLKGQPQYPLTEDDLNVLDGLRQRYLRLVHAEGESYYLFELVPNSILQTAGQARCLIPPPHSATLGRQVADYALIPLRLRSFDE